MGEQNRRKKGRKHSGAGEGHHAAATAVHHDVLTGSLHESGGACTIRVGNRASSVQQRDFHINDRDGLVVRRQVVSEEVEDDFGTLHTVHRRTRPRQFMCLTRESVERHVLAKSPHRHE